MKGESQETCKIWVRRLMELAGLVVDAVVYHGLWFIIVGPWGAGRPLFIASFSKCSHGLSLLQRRLL